MEQNNSFTKVDYNQYKDAYNKDVIQAWKDRKKEIDVETLRALMYGFTFTKAYADGDLEDALFMDYWKDLYFDQDIDMDPDFESSGSVEDDLAMMMDDDYEVDTPQERLLMETIDSTGDGKTPESALCVIDVHQEYEYISRKFPYSCLKMVKQSVSDGIDCLYFDENPFFIDRIYFDIKRRFDVGYPCSTDDVNLKPNEQQ